MLSGLEKRAVLSGFFDELAKIAINLQQLVKLENLAGKETVQDIMGSIARQSGQLGKKHTSFKPQTLIIGPKGVQRIPHLQAAAPVQAGI